jgi:hypothetical protein
MLLLLILELHRNTLLNSRIYLVERFTNQYMSLMSVDLESLFPFHAKEFAGKQILKEP